jgi:transcriptional regulator NrdR family protein
VRRVRQSASPPTSGRTSTSRRWCKKTAAASNSTAPNCRHPRNLALRKRPVSTEQIDNAIERIEELLNPGLRSKSNHLGELVMRELKKLDKVAYVRFASVYHSLKTLTNSKRWWMK